MASFQEFFAGGAIAPVPESEDLSSAPVPDRTNPSKTAIAAAMAPYIESSSPDEPFRPAPHTTGEMFIEGSRAGSAQMGSDVQRVAAMWNIAVDDEENAQRRLNLASIKDQESANLLASFGTFEEFLDEPTYESFWEQVVKNVGQFTPMAVSSIATGFTGAIVGAAAKGTISVGSRALMRKELARIVEKKHLLEKSKAVSGPAKGFATKKAAGPGAVQAKNGRWYAPGTTQGRTITAAALTAEEALILNGAFSYSQAIKAGAITGAFTQEWVMGAGQSFGEYQEAGYTDAELTKKEAAMAASLGIPQAMLGVFSEMTFVGGMARIALRKSGGRPGSRWGRLAKDIAGGFTRSATVEGITEMGQEGIQIAQRMAIDPEYTAQEALLRAGESGFAGFFAGGARGGAGGTIAGVFGTARDLVSQGISYKKDIEAGRGPGQDGGTMPESQEDIDAQVDAMLDGTTGKTSVWVPTGGPVPNDLRKKSEQAGKEIFMTTGHRDGTLYSVDQKVISKFERDADPDVKGAVDEALRQALGYTVVQRPDHDAVVNVKNAEGRTVWEQTTYSDEDSLAAAQRRANELFPDYDPELTSVEETLRQRDMFDPDSPFYEAYLEEEEGSGDLGGTMEDMAQGVNIEPPVIDHARDEQGNVLNYVPRGENVPPRAVDEATGEILVDPELEEALRLDGLVDKDGNLTVDLDLLRSLSDAFINRFLKLRKADVDKTTVFIPEERGGRHLIRTETAPASRVISTVRQVERGVRKAAENARAIAIKTLQGKGINDPSSQQIEAELKKGWGIIDEDKNVLYVDMPTLTNVGREINQQEGTTRVGDDLGTAAMGFSTIMSELAIAGYDIQHNGQAVAINEILLRPDRGPQGRDARMKKGARKKGPFDDAVIYRRGSEEFTLAQLPEMLRDKKEVKDDVKGDFDPDVDISPRTTAKQGQRRATRADVDRRKKAGLPPIKVGAVIQETVYTEGQRDAGELGLDRQRRQAAKKAAKEVSGREGEKDIPIFNEDEYLSWRFDFPTSIQDLPAVRDQGKIDVVKTRKQRRGIKEITLKDAKGFPLTKRYKTIRVSNKPAANVYASNSIATHLPGFKDFITAIQKLKFFGLQRNVYLLNQIDIRKGGLEGWAKDLGMNKTQTKEFKGAVMEWLNNEDKPGKFINFKDVDFIFIRTTANPNSVDGLKSYLALGHELGHAIYLNEVDRSLSNKKLRSALMKEFERAKMQFTREERAQSQYDGVFGFEEWFADQIAIALMKNAQGARYETTSASKREYIPYTEAEKADLMKRGDAQIKQRFGKKPTGNNRKLAIKARQEMQAAISLGKLHINPGEQKIVEGYFRGIARKIRKLFSELSNIYKKRFGKQSAVFSEYVNEVTNNYKKYHADLNSQNRAPPPYSVQVYQRDMVDAALDTAKIYYPPKVATKIRKEAKGILGKGWSAIKYLVAPSDNFLKSLGPVGREIALIFYAGSQTGNLEGFLDTRSRRVNEWMNKITQELGLSDSSAPIPQDVVEALLQAEDDTIPDSKLSRKALAARNALAKMKTDYLDKSGIKVENLVKEDKDGNTISYFGRRISLTELQGDQNKQAAFAKLISKYLAMDESKAMDIVQDLVKKGELDEAIGYELGQAGADIALGMPNNIRRQLSAIPTKEMRKIGILEPPEIYLRKYVDSMVKKVEYEKRGGHKRVNELLDQISNPTDRERARNAVKAMLGKTDGTMPNWYRKTQSVILAWNIVTLLAFAALASLPDLAGPVLRSKEFNSLKYAWLEMKNAAMNPEELRGIAKDIGVIASESIQTMYINAAELEAMTPGAKKITEGFFKYTGTEWFTNFSRIYATGMARRFLIHHANSTTSTSARYLHDMGVTQADIKATFDADGNPNFDSAAGKRVKDAMGKFVDESIVRPNAAERPVWASDPRLAFVWQLKSFFYAYGKNIIGGVIREGQTRWNNGEGIKGPATLLALAAVTLLPLSMLGLEIREFLKNGIAWLLPGVESSDKFYATDRMPWGEYGFEIADRAGAFGPWTMAIPMYQANQYGDRFWVPPLGPTAERVEDFFSKGMGYVIREGVPIYSAIGGIPADR